MTATAITTTIVISIAAAICYSLLRLLTLLVVLLLPGISTSARIGASIRASSRTNIGACFFM